MKLAGSTGVAVTPWLSHAFADGGVAGPARPQAGGNANGPLLIQLMANGGWDPTLACAPKGNALNEAFGEGDILSAGNINYAPMPGATEFWDAHDQKTVAFNGVDMKTNTHAGGQRFMGSGRLGEVYPSIAAVAAGFAAPELPMSYLSFGGYDRTAGLVVPTRNLDSDRLAELAAYKAGICVSGNLQRGGFDTHDDHDNRHIPRLTEVYGMLNFLWEEAERQGVADSLVVVVGSDFGRTPNYNADNGKDHWSTSSMMVMGAGVEGNRVLGSTDEGHNSIALDPDTLEVAADDAEVTAKISPDHVHANVRRLLGIDGSDIDEQFYLPLDHDLNLLG